MKDITIDTSTFDVLVTSRDSHKHYTLSTGARGLGDSAAYAYVDVEFKYGEMQAAVRDGFYIAVDYIADPRPMRIRLKERYVDGSCVYAHNRKNNGAWFDVCLGVSGEQISPAEMVLIDTALCFVHIDGDSAVLYSDPSEDFIVGDVENQNKELLVLCNPTNLYQHPTTGVGAINWIGSSDGRGLAERVISEMAMDGMSVVEASYDSATGNLLVEIQK